MGMGIVILVWATFLLGVGMTVGALIAHFVLPRIWEWCGKTGPSTILKIVFGGAFAFLFSVSCTTLLVVSHTRHSGDYYKDPGSFDFYRMPLVHPYQLVAANQIRIGAITKWEPEGSSGSSLVSGVDSLAVINSLVVGHTMSDHYFIFDCRNGNVSYQNNREELEKTLLSMRLATLFTMESSLDRYNRYWDEH